MKKVLDLSNQIWYPIRVRLICISVHGMGV